MSVVYSPLRSADAVDDDGKVLDTRLNLNHNANASTIPLLNTSAPIARIELDDDLDDRETVSKPYPGVDDGFFPDKNKDEQPDVEKINPVQPKPPGPDVEIIPSRPRDEQPDVEKINPVQPKPPGPDVEIIPSHPKDPEPIEPPDEVPDVTPRNGFGGSKPDDVNRRPVTPTAHKPNFPHVPGYGFPYGHDPEIGSTFGDPDSIPDVNVYQHKKTLAQGMMDLALFSANANQLRYVLESFNRHPYYLPSLALISISLILQVAVGIGLIWNATYNVKDQKEICTANRINNFTVIGVFLVTVINVFISAFGVANPP